jgi:hypothetical protein
MLWVAVKLFAVEVRWNSLLVGWCCETPSAMHCTTRCCWGVVKLPVVSDVKFSAVGAL